MNESKADISDIDAAPLPCSESGTALSGSAVADTGPNGDRGGVRTSRMFLLALVGVTGLGPFAMSSFIPALPSIQSHFAVSAAISALTLSVALLTMAVGSLFYGALADRHGRRPVMIGGVALAIVGSLVCALGPNIWVVIIGRALQAAGGTVGFVLARVIVKDFYGEQRAVSILGYIAAAMTLAPLLGPLMGGYLIEYVGWRSVFVVVAGFAAVLLAVLYAKLPETRPVTTTGSARLLQWSVFRGLLKRSAFRKYMALGAALQTTFMAFLAGAPFVLRDFYHLPASAYGWYFLGIPVGFALGSFVAGRFSVRLGGQRLVRFGTFISAASCGGAVVANLLVPFGPWGLFLPAALIAIGNGIAMPGAQVALLVAAGRHSGSGSGLFSFAQLVSGAVIAQIVGAILDSGPGPVLLVMFACALAALLMVARRDPVEIEVSR